MKISVLICTYSRHELLRRCLTALIRETIKKPDQIVIVNGGDRQADEVVSEFIREASIEIKLIKTLNKNLATSRNIGLPFCVGDIVAMTDDDAEVFPDWISRISEAHQAHPEAGAIGGSVLGVDCNSIVAKVADVVTFPSWPTASYTTTLPGVNIAYKKYVIDQIGFQDETLFRGEDVDYNWRVLKKGYRVYFDPLIKVYHNHRPTLKGLMHQHYMYGRAYFLVRKKWPEMYCLYPHKFKQLKDFLKAGHFFASLLYQPVLCSCRLRSWEDRICSWPLFVLIGILWRYGMFIQGTKTKLKMSA